MLFISETNDVLPGYRMDFVLDGVGVLRYLCARFEAVSSHPEVRSAVGLVEDDRFADTVRLRKRLVLDVLSPLDDRLWLCLGHVR